MRALALPLSLLLVLSTGAPVQADDGSAEAKLHFERGFAAYALHKYKDAALEYEKAFELKTDPALLYDAAQAWRLAGEKRRALALYESYLRMFQNQAGRVQAQRSIDKLRAELAN